MLEPVKKIIEVACSQQQAFDVFVGQVDSWWPKDQNSVSAMAGKIAQSITIEPKANGRVYEIAHDGTEHLWGSVIKYQPNDQLTLDWHINMPAEKASTVDVLFITLDQNRTRVELTHSNWEVFEDKAADMRSGYESGWVGVFEEAFSQACVQTEAAV